MSKAKHGAGHIGERQREQEHAIAPGDVDRDVTTGRSGFAERFAWRLLRVWFLLSRAHTLGVRGAAFDAAGRVFLVKHTYVTGWHLPGGGVEIGENFYAALVRELAEEGNLQLGDPAELFGIYHNNNTSRRDHVAVYVCRNVEQAENHGGDGEIADSGFFPIDALPEGTTPATARRLAEIINHQPPSLEW
ncbi:MAG: NUDIX domain-containing protein [Alphaproteobacteria bacterium]|nr:NUDIX domain-containing protein [Alphaproteobacteria bacterium]